MKKLGDLLFDSSYIKLLEYIANLVSNAKEPQISLEKILKTVILTMDVQAGWIHIINSIDKKLCLTACYGFNQDLIDVMSALEIGQYVENGLIHEEPFFCPDIHIDEKYSFISSAQIDFRSVLVVPVRIRGEIIGISGILSSATNRFKSDDIKILTIVNSIILNLIEYTRANYNARTQSLLFSDYLGEKQELLNALSHELQTPLTALKASAGLLAEEIERNKKVTQNRLVKNILSSASSLENRLVELLEISRAKTNYFHIKTCPVDVSMLLSEIVQEFIPVAREKQQSILLENVSSVKVDADAERIGQIINNLLSNALKYTQPGGQVWITSRSDNSNLIIEIKDNGPGISLDEQKKLFNPYYRIPADRRRKPGLGLGLSITKQLVELQRGKIWVESEPGKGSAFLFTIPLSKTNLNI